MRATLCPGQFTLTLAYAGEATSESWLLLNAWAKIETPFRAPPLPASVALGLIWFCVRKRRYDVAFLIAAGVDSFLRTGELMLLKNKDVSLDLEDSGTIKLTHTKSGQKHAAFESSIIQDSMVVDVYRIHQRRSPHGNDPNEFVFKSSRASFYDLFEEGMRWLGVAGLRFKPYSIRRGSASSFYRKCKSMELILERGRWSTVRVGRIYVNDGLAKETEMKLSDAVNYSLAVKSQALTLWLTQERILGQALQRPTNSAG